MTRRRKIRAPDATNPMTNPVCPRKPNPSPWFWSDIGPIVSIGGGNDELFVILGVGAGGVGGASLLKAVKLKSVAALCVVSPVRQPGSSTPSHNVPENSAREVASCLGGLVVKGWLVMIVVEAGVVILGAVVESCSSTGVNIASSPVMQTCQRHINQFVSSRFWSINWIVLLNV